MHEVKKNDQISSCIHGMTDCSLHSFCSAPQDDKFAFYVRSLGDWSNELAKKKDQLPRVRIDGPYGEVSERPEEYDVIAFCCGGIGATPLISVMRETWYKMMNGQIGLKKIYFFW